MADNFEVDVRQTNGIIEFNYQELKDKITTAVKPYTTMVVDKYGIADAKKIRANLNNFKKAIDDKRKEIKKGYLTPYEIFDRQVKDLLEIVDSGVSNVDIQLKEYEQLDKTIKKSLILEYFESLQFGLVEFDRLFEDSWLNVGSTEKVWKEQLSNKIDKIRADIKIIENMGVEDTKVFIHFYLKDFNLLSAQEEYKLLYATKSDIKPLERDIELGVDYVPEQLNVNLNSLELVIEHYNDGLLVRTFEVTGTGQQLLMLADYMNNVIKIKFTKLNKGE